MMPLGVCAKCGGRGVLRQTALRNPKRHSLHRSYAVGGDKSPLRILFFGSDSFSVDALERLRRQREDHEPALYESLDIVTREPAPSGRGLKPRTLPIQLYAETHGLKLTTVTKQSILHFDPTPFRPNLLLAVSFGLFIPPHLLRAIPHSINVHPSLLPRYRGPAPIHNAWANGDEHTGVTLQTLSTQSFDEGIIFDQSPPIPIDHTKSFFDLYGRLAEVGADMLINSLRERTFQEPVPVETSTEPSYAEKIPKYLDWEKTSRNRALRLGSMQNPATGAISLQSGRRVIVHLRGFRPRNQGSKQPPGTFFISRHAQSGDLFMTVVCSDRKAVFVEQVKVSGKDWIDSRSFVSSASDRFWGNKFVPWRKEFEDHDPNEFQ